MTKLGKVLKYLFPRFVDRLIELNNLRIEIVNRKILLRWYDGDGIDDKVEKTSNELKLLCEEFNRKKMWFMTLSRHD